MDIKTVLQENIDQYTDHLDADVAENVGRTYYRGIAAHDPDDNSLLSLLIWELTHIEDNGESTSELRWIYAVDPSFIAPLLEDYHKEAVTDRVKETVFESTALKKDEETALEENGFSLEEAESRDICVTVEECRNLALAKKAAPSYIQSIDSLEDTEFYQGLMNILFKYESPSQEDLAYLPKEWYEQSVSCYAKTDGKVNGFLLVHACPSGTLVPILFFAVGADSKMLLVEMLRYSARRVAEIYPPDTLIRIHRRNRSVSALSGKLFPDKKGAPAVTGERPEKD